MMYYLYFLVLPVKSSSFFSTFTDFNIPSLIASGLTLCPEYTKNPATAKSISQHFLTAPDYLRASICAEIADSDPCRLTLRSLSLFCITSVVNNAESIDPVTPHPFFYNPIPFGLFISPNTLFYIGHFSLSSSTSFSLPGVQVYAHSLPSSASLAPLCSATTTPDSLFPALHSAFISGHLFLPETLLLWHSRGTLTPTFLTDASSDVATFAQRVCALVRLLSSCPASGAIFAQSLAARVRRGLHIPLICN